MKVRDACAQRNVPVFYAEYSWATMTRNDGGCEFYCSRHAAPPRQLWDTEQNQSRHSQYTIQNVHAHQPHSLNLQVDYS